MLGIRRRDCGGTQLRLVLPPVSTNRGGNLTGWTITNIELGPKQLKLLHELVPTASSVALLVNAAMPALAEPTTITVQAASRTLGVWLHVLKRCATRPCPS
jgi:putative ABC transport system substrate-binding protein